MNIVTLGIDLAKNIFALHGVDQIGRALLVKPRIARDQLLPLIASLPPCLIGMEACSGAPHWARLFRQHGHTVKLMAPKFVTPYRLSDRRGKNDAQDAAAIAEAVTRPTMRFVPIKEQHQQIILCLHRTRQGFVEERTAIYNRLRGPIIASALLASIGNGHDFKNGRQVAAWIGLTPGQHSRGGKARLGHITKAGDNYRRGLLVMGARAVLNGVDDKQDYFSCWARRLVERRGYWRAVVAIAAKKARLAWAVLKYGEDFRMNECDT